MNEGRRKQRPQLLVPLAFQIHSRWEMVLLVFVGGPPLLESVSLVPETLDSHQLDLFPERRLLAEPFPEEMEMAPSETVALHLVSMLATSTTN